MSDTISHRLEQCYTGALFDVLREMGYPHQALPTTLRPLHIASKLAGRVFTVEGRRDDTLTADETLLKWCELLAAVPAGHVVVCQPNDSTVSHMGELSAETLTYRQVRGYIVDGGCRDSAFIEKLGFPVFCRYYTPVDIVGKWAATALGEPIQIGGIQVNTGDYVIADRDGVIIIPSGIAEEATTRAEAVLQTENLVRKAILQGVDPVKAYLQFGKF